MKSLKSFKFAFRGLAYGICNERNIRIHTVIAFYALLFSKFFNLTEAKYGLLFLTIALVISSEMVNTAIEELTDLSSENYNPLARISKDLAAGAVLVCSLFSIAIAVLLFGKAEGFINICNYFFKNIWMFFLFVLSGIVSLYYIFLGPVGIKTGIKNIFKKLK